VWISPMVTSKLDDAGVDSTTPLLECTLAEAAGTLLTARLALR
jgi:hypothetical protein